MLRVHWVSGEELGSFPLHLAPDGRSLKRQLPGLCGLPRF
ncbi:hypothetical protein AK812_SmicGene47881, partial [Symbiodinium microadriaticum]